MKLERRRTFERGGSPQDLESNKKSTDLSSSTCL
jgi:hypothetical protein